jgi:SAM-dependent methyltransferase
MLNNIKDEISAYGSRDLESRKQWYSPAAEAYDRVRPRYPETLIQRSLEQTPIGPDSPLLEIGCGPGTLTTALARRNFQVTALEPNPEFYRLATQNCRLYDRVSIENSTFEEWPLVAGHWQAVFAATSFHWIDPAIGYPKVAEALRPGGVFILLWNKELQPSYDIHRDLADCYPSELASLARYEDAETQEGILAQLGALAIESGYFRDLRMGIEETIVTYSAEDYVSLLMTYSPYLKLDETDRNRLFESLKNKINGKYGGQLELSCRSAFHQLRSV